MGQRAAIWGRVSGDEQEAENQLLQLHRLAEARGLDVARTYETEASAWNGDHRPAVEEALVAAHRGEWQVLLVWALDRLSREGIEATLRTLRQFRERGVTVVSLQEPWLDGPGEVQELITAILAWAAKFESQRRSERVKAGLARRKAEGEADRPSGWRQGREAAQAQWLLRALGARARGEELKVFRPNLR
jgi:putative DNA-invertase from lambdoid prophage Rac